MREWKPMMPLEAMERISRQELCDRFDEVLEKVEKEDVGIVILNPDGTDGQILCPASWFDFCFDKDFGNIITCALRYALEKPIDTADIVIPFIEKYLNVLDADTVSSAIDDIEKAASLHSNENIVKLKEQLVLRRKSMQEIAAENETKKIRQKEKESQ